MIRSRVVYYGHPKHLKRAVRRGLKRGLERAVLYWHRKLAKHHFKRGAAARYGYAKRGTKYKRRKRRTHGHDNPLEYSGMAKRQLLRYIRVTSSPLGRSPKVAKGAFRGPRYFWMTGKGQPNKGKELVAMIPREEAALGRVVGREVQRELNAAERIRTTRRMS